MTLEVSPCIAMAFVFFALITTGVLLEVWDFLLRAEAEERILPIFRANMYEIRESVRLRRAFIASNIANFNDFVNDVMPQQNPFRSG